jgi:feruloyl esterase
MFIAAFGVIACASAVFAEPTSAQRCEAIAKLALPDVAITSATLQTTGALKSDLGGTLTNLPLFCRVIGDATPTPRSHIGFEVWLPVDGWTGRYVQVGNGGLAGVIFHELMAQMLGRGHAVAATDDGHKGSPIDGSWAIGEPEKVRDFAERAVHVTNGIGKRVTTEYYGDRARHSYFFGCSEGGREALIAAQRFPEDFDGIVAGAPGNDWNNLLTAFVWNAQALHRDEGTFIPPDRLPAIQAAALAACDATDGVKDGIVSQPDRCKFDPRVLACGKAPADACLTQPQIERSPGSMGVRTSPMASRSWRVTCPREKTKWRRWGAAYANTFSVRHPARASTSLSPPATSADWFSKRATGTSASSTSRAICPSRARSSPPRWMPPIRT